VGLLCFDEFQCNDIFTAVTLSTLFTKLIEHGTIIVSTSNRPPEQLNAKLLSGPQAVEFDNFLAHLAMVCEPWPLDSGVDYRRTTMEHDSELPPIFRHPLSLESTAALDADFIEACDACGCDEGPQSIPVAFGRTLDVPEGTSSVARFRFRDLCDAPVGATDFAALAQQYHTVFLTDVPQLSITRRNEARRFITLVDELYNHHAVLHCSAEVAMEDLFEGEDDAFVQKSVLEQMESLQFETEVEGTKLRRDLMASGSVSPVSTSQGSSKGSLFTGEEERFAFDRALSRLVEMQSRSYRTIRALA